MSMDGHGQNGRTRTGVTAGSYPLWYDAKRAGTFMSTDKVTMMRRETIDGSVPVQGPAKSSRVDLGIAILQAVAVPGVRYTHDEISAFAGCTRSAIQQIEARALHKLRRRLLLRKDPVLRELFENLTGRAA